MAKRQPATLEPEQDNYDLDVSKLQRREVVELETFASFARRHGDYIIVGDALEVRPGVYHQKIIFEDGARAVSTHPTRHQGQEPPEHPLAVLRNQWEYYGVKLARAQEAHQHYLADCQGQASYHLQFPNSCPPPPANWREAIAKGNEKIAALKTKLKGILEELERVDPELIARRARRQANEDHYAKASAELEELMAAGGEVVNAGAAGMCSPDPSFKG